MLFIESHLMNQMVRILVSKNILMGGFNVERLAQGKDWEVMKK